MRVAARVIGREPDQARAARRRGRARPGPRREPVDRERLARASLPTVMRGLSDEYGSWKMICISRRSARSSPLVERRDVAAVEAHAARGRLDQAQDAAPVVVLPQPDSRRPARASRPRGRRTRRRRPPCTCPTVARDRALAGSGSTSSGRATSSSGRSPSARSGSTSALTRTGDGRRVPACDLVRAPAARRGGRRRTRAAAGLGAAARRSRPGSAGGSGSPAGSSSGFGHHAGDHAQPLALLARASGSEREEARGVGMQRCAANSVVARRAYSTTWPAYITTTRSARLGDHAEVVGDEQDRHAQLLLQPLEELEDLRLDGDVERGGRLVGDEQRRAGRRAPSRSSRAGACRPRAGAGTRRRAARATGCRPAAASRSARARASPRRRPSGAARIASTIWSPTVKTGFSEVIGSWKIIEISLPRMRAHLGARRASSRFVPSEAGSRPPTMRPGGLGMRRRIESAVTHLPQPDSPTSPASRPRRPRTTRRRRRAPRRRR